MMLLEDKCLSSRGFIQRIMDLKPPLDSRDHGHCRAQELGKSKSHIWVCLQLLQCWADPLALGGGALLSSQSSSDLFLGGSGPSLQPGWGYQPLVATRKLPLEPGRAGVFPNVAPW